MLISLRKSHIIKGKDAERFLKQEKERQEKLNIKAKKLLEKLPKESIIRIHPPIANCWDGFFILKLSFPSTSPP